MDRLIERFKTAISASQHDGAFHHCQYVTSKRVRINVSRQPAACIGDERRNRFTPRIEILDDQPPHLRMAVADFQSQVADRAAQDKIGALKQSPIAIQYSENPFNWIADSLKCGSQNPGLQHALIVF